MNTNLRKLKKAHYALMAKYIDVLNQVSKLPFFVTSQFTVPIMDLVLPRKMLKLIGRTTRASSNSQSTGWTKIFSLRYLVRLFVESHIKGKLTELSVAYSYLAQKVPTDKQYETWLKETSEDCDKLATTLTSWQSFQGIVSALWPFIVGVATARLAVETIYEVIIKIDIDARGLITVGLFMIFPLIYFSLFISSSFESKRELFMPGFDRDEKPMDINQPAGIHNIVYYLEDQVFNLAGRGKGHEIPMDVIGTTLGLLTFAVTPILVWMDDPSNPLDIILWISGGLFLLLAIASILFGRQRKWN